MVCPSDSRQAQIGVSSPRRRPDCAALRRPVARPRPRALSEPGKRPRADSGEFRPSLRRRVTCDDLRALEALETLGRSPNDVSERGALFGAHAPPRRRGARARFGAPRDDLLAGRVGRRRPRVRNFRRGRRAKGPARITRPAACTVASSGKFDV